MLTWFACGAATKMIGPLFGILYAPLGWTSRKKRSTRTLSVASASASFAPRSLSEAKHTCEEPYENVVHPWVELRIFGAWWCHCERLFGFLPLSLGIDALL